jgi:Mn-containing catalase
MSQLKELLIEELQDILHAENQLVAALPKMAQAAKAPKLREAFEKHLEQTQLQVERLNQVFETLGSEPEPTPCRAMVGLIEESEERIEESTGKDELSADLALITAPKKSSTTKSPPMAMYGTWPSKSKSVKLRVCSATRSAKKRARITF